MDIQSETTSIGVEETTKVAARRLAWAAVWLAAALVVFKSMHLGPPGRDLSGFLGYWRSLAAISYADALFVASWWLAGRLAFAVAGDRPRFQRIFSMAFVAASAFLAFYGLVNAFLFDLFGGFLSYPLLSLVANVSMVRSSIGAYLTLATIAGLIGVPLGCAVAAMLAARVAPPRRTAQLIQGSAIAVLMLWVGVGQAAFEAQWRSRSDRRIAANSQWVLLSSWWRGVTGSGIVQMNEAFSAADLADFEPVRQSAASVKNAIRRASAAINTRVAAARRPPNVILIVLESVAARWTSLGGGPYTTTPTLEAESKRSLVFPNAYAHIGRSSNSLAAILMSAYPRLDFREITEQYPNLPGTSLATLLRDRGYRTTFMTPSDLSWAEWDNFLTLHGFSDLRDHRDLATCGELLSSWGMEDRCMVDAMVQYVGQERSTPFFLMAWTTQTHNPYVVSPGVPELNLLQESTPDDWELGRYLNIVHETDRQLARVFDAVRRNGLAQDTLIVVVGDHGQAFGYPHENNYFQGRTVYQEDVNVPLMFWFPRAYQKTARPNTIASHVDLAPTIAELAGLPAAPDWVGRSLLDLRQDHRAYFYVAEDSFTLGVREDKWKYIYDLRDGTEELYDLEQDPNEQQNLAAAQPDRCARLRQRLAAWTDANRRQYERIAQ